MSMYPESENAISYILRNAAYSKRIVFVSGNFNIIHPGHLRLLRFAVECGDYLVVGVQDKRNKNAVMDEALRLEGVKAISMVNHAFLLHDSPEDFIAALKPAVVVKGKEHENSVNPEKAALDGYGGELLFGSGDITFSSIDLLQREFRESNISSVRLPMDFPKRHGFSMAALKNRLAAIKGLRVAVIGDLIVDKYITCDPLGLSQEDPTIVVTPILEENFIGGAAIVAAHAGSLGAEVTFFSIAGEDDIAQYAQQKLNEYQINAKIIEDSSRPTILKERYRANGKTLLRVSRLRHHDINKELQRVLVKGVRDIVDKIDLLIFSDFNYGCLPTEVVRQITALCADKKVKMAADSQSSSQVGDVSRFHGMMLMTPTEREARLAVRDYNAGLVVLADSLRKKSKAQNVILTLGSEGCLIHAEAPSPVEFITDQLPAFNLAPKDTAGAGDSFLTCASLAITGGASIWEGTYLGSLASACQVGRVGNIPITTKEIEAEIGTYE